ncbi:MAG: ABC transporter permease [Chloroflexi bacterium]|jgi:D-methionine transport system permease protein|nr:ABC transporter permease [Chloroflexota bacterium]GIW11351.1 MAG: ABC transporter permease [Dehalococcoidia bacterium]
MSWTEFQGFLPDLLLALGQTFEMVAICISAAVLLGTPLGVLLYLTAGGGLHENRLVYQVTGYLVNMVRSFPFIILMVALIPLTRVLTGTSIGPRAAAVSLSVAAIPFFARLVEQSLREVPRGVIEMALASGATTRQIVTKVLLSEARPALLSSIVITTISFLSYSAVAGAIGGGGIGDLAIRFGYYRFRTDVMVTCVVVMVIIVQVTQWMGNALVRRVDKR